MTLSTGTCNRCGKRGPGQHQWMFYYWDWLPELLSGSPARRDFFCFRCLRIMRIMRIYGIIGMTIFAIIIVVIISATIWAWTSP